MKSTLFLFGIALLIPAVGVNERVHAASMTKSDCGRRAVRAGDRLLKDGRARLSPADDQEYSPKWLTDLEASYQVAGYRLAVGAQNLFDVFPDRNNTVNSFDGIQTFPSQSPFGMNGRAIYARIGRIF